MSRLGSGNDSEEEEEEEAAQPVANKKLTYKSKIAQVVVAQSGKKFAVRQIDATKEHIVELGRFCSLEEAFSFIEDLAASKPVGKKSSGSASKAKRRDQDGSWREEDEEDDDDDMWCSHCVDDDRVVFCAFCGCKVSGRFQLNGWFIYNLRFAPCSL